MHEFKGYIVYSMIMYSMYRLYESDYTTALSTAPVAGILS